MQYHLPIKSFNTMSKILHIIISILLITVLLSTDIKSQKINITKLGINTSNYSELAPNLHDSTLYFISNRKSRVLVNFFNQDNEFLYKLYSAPLLADGTIGKTSIFDLTETKTSNSGPITFSADDSLLITTQNAIQRINSAKSDSKQNQLFLFQSSKQNGIWQDLEKIPFDFGEYSVSHPNLSPDKNMLLFISNSPQGYGKTDIYMSERTNSGWSKPENLGNIINTSGSELFPFIHKNGRLYFTSDGHGGKGKMDIFYSTYDSVWSVPKALEAPINSEYDDFSCYISPNGSYGYFSSNREGTDNIYKFELELSFFENPKEVIEDNYCFTFYEESSLDKDTLPLQYRWEFSDGKQMEGNEVDHCFEGPNLYKIHLHVIDSITGEALYSVAEYELLLEETKQVYFSSPDTIKVGDQLYLEAELKGFGDTNEVEYSWNLGEEKEIHLGKTIYYNYRKKGTYTIKCEAYWNNNQLCSFRKIVVE